MALLLASVGFVVYDLVAFRRPMSEDLMTRREIIGANSMAALAFRDGPAASEILSALKAREGMVAAALYTPRRGTLGRLSAGRRRRERARASRCERLAVREQPSRVFHRIVLHGEMLGTSADRVRHAALGCAAQAIYGHRLHADAGRCRRRLPVFIVAAADHLRPILDWNETMRTYRPARTSRCGRPSRMTTKLVR